MGFLNFVAYYVCQTAMHFKSLIINTFSILGINVRLVGGSHNAGRVEVYYNGTWGTVCDYGWDKNDARVVCRQLGFQDAEADVCCGGFGRGTGQIWLNGVDCVGHELSLFSCGHEGMGIHNCDHGEDAGVRCKGPRGENTL
jgi:hypothetical protein